MTTNAEFDETDEETRHHNDGCKATWGRLLAEFEEKSKVPNTTAVLHSVETYSILPDNPFVIKELRNLLKKFKVRGVILYRPSFTWYPSSYKQQLKHGMYGSRGNRWHNYNNNGAIPTMPQWLRVQHGHDSLNTYEFYSKVFGGRDDAEIVVQDMTVDRFEIPFICDAIRSSTACEAT